ncbi:SnoaL domain-containing protein [Trichostrongylus colubriformis]|uniref:SnoaL domain-containing protein n=1 Tax=Trichostrongylus colubriformis TaxID=6319 RepID=A0AAN8FKI6_TRICO
MSRIQLIQAMATSVSFQKTTEDVKAILEPRYESMEKYYLLGDMEKLMNFYHPDAMVIDNGINVAYTRNEIKMVFKKYFDKYGTVGFEISDAEYLGCDDHLVYHCKCLIPSSETNVEKVKITSIWKCCKGDWLIYYEEYASDE